MTEEDEDEWREVPWRVEGNEGRRRKEGAPGRGDGMETGLAAVGMEGERREGGGEEGATLEDASG